MHVNLIPQQYREIMAYAKMLIPETNDNKSFKAIFRASYPMHYYLHEYKVILREYLRLVHINS